MRRVAALVLAALCLPAGAEDKVIAVLGAAAGERAATPDAPLWRRASAVRVPLQAAFPAHPYVSGTPSTPEITVQAARVGRRLYLRLEWIDGTVDDSIEGTHRFADAAAVQFPLDGSADTTPYMGDGEHAVNIWHWRADGRVENLLARGFGTAERVAGSALQAAAARTPQGWAVVLGRPLRARPDEGASLVGRKQVPIAFAAWNGANEERDGFKAVTLDWWRLSF